MRENGSAGARPRQSRARSVLQLLRSVSRSSADGDAGGPAAPSTSHRRNSADAAAGTIRGRQEAAVSAHDSLDALHRGLGLCRAQLSTASKAQREAAEGMGSASASLEAVAVSLARSVHAAEHAAAAGASGPESVTAAHDQARRTTDAMLRMVEAQRSVAEGIETLSSVYRGLADSMAVFLEYHRKEVSRARGRSRALSRALAAAGRSELSHQRVNEEERVLALEQERIAARLAHVCEFASSQALAVVGEQVSVLQATVAETVRSNDAIRRHLEPESGTRTAARTAARHRPLEISKPTNFRHNYGVRIADGQMEITRSPDTDQQSNAFFLVDAHVRALSGNGLRADEVNFVADALRGSQDGADAEDKEHLARARQAAAVARAHAPLGGCGTSSALEGRESPAVAIVDAQHDDVHSSSSDDVHHCAYCGAESELWCSETNLPVCSAACQGALLARSNAEDDPPDWLKRSLTGVERMVIDAVLQRRSSQRMSPRKWQHSSTDTGDYSDKDTGDDASSAREPLPESGFDAGHPVSFRVSEDEANEPCDAEPPAQHAWEAGERAAPSVAAVEDSVPAPNRAAGEPENGAELPPPPPPDLWLD